jgi:hypothetical protein
MGGVRDLTARLARKAWGAVVVDEQNEVPGLQPAYYLGERLRYRDADTLRTKTGFLVRPALVWYAQDPVERALRPGVTGNFEGGRYEGWTPTGTAFGEAPAATARMRGAQGDRLAESAAAETGRLTSAPIRLDAARLTFLMAGNGKVALRVLVDGREVARRAPAGRADTLDRLELDVSRWRDHDAVIELLDDDPRGTLRVDDLRLVD